MDIVVCAKQVPNVAEVRLDPETNTLRRDGVESIMNPFDRHALEAGVQLVETHGGTVTVLTMGPPQAEEMLREAISCGADQGVLLSDRAFAGADTWATSYTLAAAIRRIGSYDCVLCGRQAIDGDTAQVGPELAERLGIPFVSAARRIEFADGYFRAERLMDDGYDAVEVAVPVLFTVVKEINEPRPPSLKGKMRAKKADIPVWGAADLEVEAGCLGLAGSPTQVVRVFAPERRKDRVMIEGEPARQAARLAAELRAVLRGRG